MVTRGMLDKEILWELEDDWPSVRAKGAKVAHKRMERTKKGGGKIPCDQVDEVKFVSKNHNHWFIQIIYERFHQADWFMRACCRVDDTESGSPEYYLLRGFTSVGSVPYFFRFRTHALKQMAKRIPPDKGLRAGMSMEQLAVAAFGVHETAIFQMANNAMPAIISEKERDERETVYFFCYNGIFVGRHIVLDENRGRKQLMMFQANTYINLDMAWGITQKHLIPIFFKYHKKENRKWYSKRYQEWYDRNMECEVDHIRFWEFAHPLYQ